jgi:hypothetical protein
MIESQLDDTSGVAGVFLAVALVLAGFCLWSIRRRRLSP